MAKELKCSWVLYSEEYYETECSYQIDIDVFENLSMTFCPNCGDKIKTES